MHDYLKELNEQQREAVIHKDGKGTSLHFEVRNGKQFFIFSCFFQSVNLTTNKCKDLYRSRVLEMIFC